ncbi:ATP-binding cassette domain-containing protein [Streptomyces atratus]|uniref:ABC transporter ATP-binding protein n=1 Tax=Streptomyces atratus TaxID=1893 RepID=UPI0016702290|nr:ATP-binding cassette domain-containing protein [Streptomyces atratus]WPW26305.1 ATP-binding cassette domain-containing protein [Streptomyces atratus]GGT65811.1 ABC transporter ATP-binding protein [Streptomyces atratus]
MTVSNASPAAPDRAPVLQARGLRRVFRVPRTADRPSGELVAVDDVSFTLPCGGSLAIVGESGSGKTTVARMLVGLDTPTAGDILIDGEPAGPRARSRTQRRIRARKIQMVFQDPYGSLDRRQTVASCLDEILRVHFDLSAEQRVARVAELADLVGLDERMVRGRPTALSGGQRQRVAIARALAAEPDVVILDEAVAALDVSIQAQVLNLLADIRDRTSISYLLISHDLAVVRQLCEEAIVMHCGSVVECGPTDRILDDPQHPYTQRLRASVPGPGWVPGAAPQPSETRAGEPT